MAAAIAAPARLASGTGENGPARHRRAEDDGEHRAERRAGRDAERERRRQRVAQQRLKDDAGGGQRGADERAGKDARHPRDEEDLRVDVVAERDGPIEDARAG